VSESCKVRRGSRLTADTGAAQVFRSAVDGLVPLAVGNGLTNLFGAIALATAGGTIFGTLGAMLVMPAILVGRRAGK